MSDITLGSLIQEHKERLKGLKYHNTFIPYYDFDNMDNYHLWVETTKRYIRQHFPNDPAIKEFETLSTKEIEPEQQKRLVAIIAALAIIPASAPHQRTKTTHKEVDKGVNITINNTNSQSQSQEQSMAVELFIEAIKDDLTGRQIKELKSVVAEADNDLQKARPSIIAKLKEFGTDVASNIVANLLTNPMIWGGL
ncbi:MAG: peptide chain release factor 1 [Alistipes sp.]|nr:peptide chain release factor 1 [Alistipes sp.]